MSRREHIVELLKERADELRGIGVEEIGVFGSVARGEDREDSDVDILVRFLPGSKTFRNFNRLCDFLEREIGPKFDLLTPEGLSPYMGPTIMREVEYVRIAS